MFHPGSRSEDFPRRALREAEECGARGFGPRSHSQPLRWHRTLSEGNVESQIEAILEQLAQIGKYEKLSAMIKNFTSNTHLLIVRSPAVLFCSLFVLLN